MGSLWQIDGRGISMVCLLHSSGVTVQRKKNYDFAENQAFRGSNFAISVCIIRVCVQRFRVFGERWLPIDVQLPLSSLWSSSSFPKEQWATWPHFVLTSLQSDSQYFLVFRLPPPDCTFLEISTPNCWRTSLLLAYSLTPSRTQQPELSVWGRASCTGCTKADPWCWDRMQGQQIPFSWYCRSPVISLCLTVGVQDQEETSTEPKGP